MRAHLAKGFYSVTTGSCYTRPPAPAWNGTQVAQLTEISCMESKNSMVTTNQYRQPARYKFALGIAILDVILIVITLVNQLPRLQPAFLIPFPQVLDGCGLMVHAGGDMLLLRSPGAVIWIALLVAARAAFRPVAWCRVGRRGWSALPTGRCDVLPHRRDGYPVPARDIHVPAQPVRDPPGGQAE